MNLSSADLSNRFGELVSALDEPTHKKLCDDILEWAEEWTSMLTPGVSFSYDRLPHWSAYYYAMQVAGDPATLDDGPREEWNEAFEDAHSFAWAAFLEMAVEYATGDRAAR